METSEVVMTAPAMRNLAVLAMMFVPLAAQAQKPPPAPPAAAQSPAAKPAVEPKVLDILKATCGVLSGAATLSFTAVNTYERAAANGQPLYYTTLNRVVLQRPDKLLVVSPGDGVADEFYYDGHSMTAYVPAEDLVAVAEAPPTIDQLIDAAWEKAAIYFPFSDVIVSDPCAVFRQKMGSGFYVGQSVVVGGTTTDIVAVAGEDVQAELWIGAADHLPRLIRVVYPNEPAHALYQTEYADWHVGEKVEPHVFVADKAANAKKMPFVAPDSSEPAPRPAEPPRHP
jgi:hypothetical protein